MNPQNFESINEDPQIIRSESIDNRTITAMSIEDKIKQKKTNEDHLHKNKKKLLRQFTILFVILLFIIIERIIYSIVTEIETNLLIDLQEWFGLRKSKITEFEEMDYFNNNFLFSIAGSVHKNGISIMIFTNYFITLYVGFDALIAVKILYTSYFSVFIVAFLQLIYADPRPFWVDEKLVTSLCIPSYGNPSYFVCQLAFTLYYTIYCYKTKNHTRSFKTYDQKIGRKVNQIQIGLGVVILIYSILLYLMALQYMINMILGLIYCFIFYGIYVTFENQINNLLKHSTIMNIDSKRYVFYITFFLLITEIIAASTFSNNYEIIDIEWTNNFMNCLFMTNNNALNVPAQLLMGPHFTFQKTSVIFALIGALFGVSHCFRHINTLEWYKGDLKKRVLRILVINVLTIPGWIFAVNVENIALNKRMFEWGASFFLMESLCFLVLYYLLFGIVPLYIFKRLRLNASNSSSYVQVRMQE